MLELKKINKCYKTGEFSQVALSDISLTFRKNEFVSVLGPSGSGKTTLLNIIGGLDNYDSGNLIINGVSTKKFKDKDWDYYRNSCVGFIFQGYNLINHVSVLNNVEMSLALSGVSSSRRRKKAIAALKKVGLEKHINKKPNQLSGGQMQRVAIARALVNDPEIILADEPTGALDSKTSIEIMKLIKEISKDKLVIMVTHNKELAEKYSSRIVKLKDGVLKEDTNPAKENDTGDDNLIIKKTKMSFMAALKLSLDNIKTKKGRTFLTAFASSIGIIGIALILSISNGFNKQIDSYELSTLSNFPINISKSVSVLNTKENKENMAVEDFPNEKALYPKESLNNNKIHNNKIDDEYVNFIEKIDKSKLSAISYYNTTKFNILSSNNHEVKQVNSENVNFISVPKDVNNISFLENNYDLLAGNYPNKKEELVIIVDNKNRIDKVLLDALYIDSSREEISFSEVLNKELKLVFNDDYYKEVSNSLFTKNEIGKEMYNNSNNISLRIVGIVRAKKDNDLALIMDGMSNTLGANNYSKLAYQEELLDEVINHNKSSKIVLSQEKSDGIVWMGNVSYEQLGITKDEALTMLGANKIPSMINIYPKSFENKNEIIKYLNKYNDKKNNEDKIIYTDYAKEISNLSSNIMNAITIVLVAFSSISLVVSSIMIGIITYISVLERTKEIGILRSLGARKKDITRVFNAETLIIGIISGVLGIFITWLLLFPINSILYNLTNLKNVAILNPIHAAILIMVSVSLTLIGGFIPAKIASKKDPVESLRTEV